MDKKPYSESFQNSTETTQTAKRGGVGFSEFDTKALTQGTLVSKVSLLTCVSFMFLAAGSMFGIKTEPNMFLWIASIAVTFGGLFFLPRVNSPVAAMAGLAVWNAVFGVLVGFGLQGYIETIGANTVATCLGGTAGVMAVVGSIGAFSGVDFRPMQKFLMFALFGMIIVGLSQFFIHFSAGVNIVYAVGGLVVFTGFFLVDFCRLAKSTDNSWPEATSIALAIVLDYVNFAFYLMRLVRELKK
ncbi:hypothetical protein BH11CYA1_BH11CYA1_10390 [soil metagenome]